MLLRKYEQGYGILLIQTKFSRFIQTHRSVDAFCKPTWPYSAYETICKQYC